jgi:hypothetical protein
MCCGARERAADAEAPALGREMKRGEVWWARLDKRRPVVSGLARRSLRRAGPRNRRPRDDDRAKLRPFSKVA